MTSRLPAPLIGALVCLPLLLLAHCSVDQRGLTFGFGVSHGSSTSVAEGGFVANDPSGNAGDGQGGVATNDGGARAGIGSAGGDAAVAGGAPNSGGSHGGGTAGSVSAAGAGIDGTAGSGSEPEVGCGDLDQNNVQDCDETLTRNAGFDTTIQDWVADTVLTQVWQATDARGDATSGSILLTFATSGALSGWSLAATGQCLPAWSQTSYEVGARAYIPAGQGEGRATITLVIFGNADCAGPFLGSETPTFMGQTGGWQTMHASFKTPPGTRSVLVRLGASKPASQSSMNVSFDDVLFRKN